MPYHEGQPEVSFSILENSHGFADNSVCIAMDSQQFQKPRGTTPLSVGGQWLPSSPGNSHFILQQTTSHFPGSVASHCNICCSSAKAEETRLLFKSDRRITLTSVLVAISSGETAGNSGGSYHGCYNRRYKKLKAAKMEIFSKRRICLKYENITGTCHPTMLCRYISHWCGAAWYTEKMICP